MREICIDTETTGLDPAAGDRIVEVGCVELVNRINTGRTFHSYFNPERKMPKDAEKVHGLTDEFLAKQPLFADKMRELMAFIDGAPLVAHNAPFDRSFLNAELPECWRISEERMIDTLQLANQRHPGARNTLNSLCNRYNISLKRRGKHGALLDAELLARVYIELAIGERQVSLDLDGAKTQAIIASLPVRKRPLPLPRAAIDVEGHRAFIMNAKIIEPIWLQYWSQTEERMAA